MLPEFISIGSLWCVLPPSIHDATLQEIETRFATNERRKLLFNGFTLGTKSLLDSGCKCIFLDGSFVTDKPEPGDYDACWDPCGVDVQKLDPVLLDFDNRRKKQKDKYLGEFFPSSASADGHSHFVDYFQMDKYTGKAKGIIRVQFP